MVVYGLKDCYDVAILIGGDGIYRPAIQWVKKNNKKVEIWAFRHSLSNRIKKEVHSENITYLDECLDEILR